MNDNLPSEFMSLEEFMTDIRDSILSRQFMSSEEPDESIEEFIGDGGSARKMRDMSESGGFSDEDSEDIEDASSDNAGGDGGDDDGGESETDDFGADGKPGTADDTKPDKPTKADVEYAARRTAEAAQTRDGRSVGRSGLTSPEREAKRKEAVEKAAYDPVGVKADILKAIKESKERVSAAQKGVDDKTGEEAVSKSQAPTNITTIVKENQQAPITDGAHGQNTDTVKADLPNGTSFSGSVSDALKTAADLKLEANAKTDEAWSRQWNCGCDGECPADVWDCGCDGECPLDGCIDCEASDWPCIDDCGCEGECPADCADCGCDGECLSDYWDCGCDLECPSDYCADCGCDGECPADYCGDCLGDCPLDCGDADPECPDCPGDCPTDYCGDCIGDCPADYCTDCGCDGECPADCADCGCDGECVADCLVDCGCDMECPSDFGCGDCGCEGECTLDYGGICTGDCPSDCADCGCDGECPADDGPCPGG